MRDYALRFLYELYWPLHNKLTQSLIPIETQQKVMGSILFAENKSPNIFSLGSN